MKRDEVLDWMGRTVEYIREHGRNLALIAAVIVVAAVATAVVFSYRAKQAERGNELLFEAVAAYEAAIDPVNPDPGDARNPIFGSEESRRLEATERFSKVRDQYKGGPIGAVATAYLGDLAADSGDTERARELWQEALDGASDSMLAGRLQMNLINLRKSGGDFTTVVEELRELLNSPRSPLPGDVLLYELGMALQELDRTSEAESAFDRLIEEYESSPYVGPARQQLNEI